MNLSSWFIDNPVKVSVGIILVVMFGLIAMFQMPMQLSPNVQRPAISVQTSWPGASPREIENEIVIEQEEQLKSVEGVTKMSSECSDSRGEVNLEFQVGTNMQEAILKVNSQLQQVREYPIDANQPRIRTSSTSDRSIAWFILSARPPTNEDIESFLGTHPDLASALQPVLNATSISLRTMRLRNLAKVHPEVTEILPPDIEIPKFRKFTEDVIESQFERVKGVADAGVRGGQIRQLQVIVNAEKLAGRGLTVEDLRNALLSDNQDVSGGDFWEGKRRYVVRTLGQYRDVDQVADQVITTANNQTVYVRDVAEVRMGFQKPTGFVRRYGAENIAISVQRESNANVIDVIEGLKREAQRLNDGVLKRRGMILTQVYDETVYINSAVGLVQQNIVLGGSLTIIILMLFLHLGVRTLIWVPLLIASAIGAIFVSPWFFVATVLLVLVAGLWFARGTLVIALAIPTSIIGTFLVLNGLGRSLNVISLAGLAFAVGMLVDNAVVVLENVYRYHQMGHKPVDAARLAVGEVWGAVLASTLTTLAVFLPIIFLEGEAGQLFVDIALAISAAVGLSLIISVIVIPTAAARMLKRNPHLSESRKSGSIEESLRGFGSGFTESVIGINRMIQKTWLGRLGFVAAILVLATGVVFGLMPEVEYLPAGNRNLVFCSISPPPGYNVQKLASMGKRVEDKLRPYWDIDPTTESTEHLEYPSIRDFFYIARETSVFVGLRAHDELQARKLNDLIQAELKTEFPGSFVRSFQSSLFGRGLGGGREIEIEITGPDLEELVDVGATILKRAKESFPEGTQIRPVPSLDLNSPEMHVKLKPEQASASGINNRELGYVVNTLVDGAYAADYYIGGDKIDLVILGSENYESQTQDLETQYIATRNLSEPVRLDSIASVDFDSGPQAVNRRERERAISIEVSPPAEMTLESAIERIQNEVVAPLEAEGILGAEYKANLSGTADKLAQTWSALQWNLVLAVLITYLLMAALFESWVYPLVILLSVPMGAVGGILGLKLLSFWLVAKGEPPQSLDVLTMLGFIILIGTVVNNAILIVHQTLVFREEGETVATEAILKSIRARIRPIFMTTTTTVFGLSPLVFFPGAGSELYRGLGSVVLGGLLLSTLFTLFLVPTLLRIAIDIKAIFSRLVGAQVDEEVASTV